MSDARDELRRLLDSGVKVSRLRVLALVCPHDRTLAEILRVNGHHLVYARVTQSATIGNNQTADEELVMLKRGDGHTVRNLDEMDNDAVADVSTSCCQRQISVGWMRDQLTGVSRRVVVQDSAH